MVSENVSANVVIVAQRLNPSILSQLWLVQNDVVKEDEFAEDCVFTPEAVAVKARGFSLLVLPDRLQFALEQGASRGHDLVLSRVGAIVHKLPHTPFTAVGLNFVWHLQPEPEGFPGFLRKLFWREQSGLYAAFDVPDARFGAYLSRDMLGLRLKLDIKPLQREEASGRLERLQLSLNFHCDVSGDDRAGKVLQVLGKWREAQDIAAEIVATVEEG